MEVPDGTEDGYISTDLLPEDEFNNMLEKHSIDEDNDNASLEKLLELPTTVRHNPPTDVM